MEISLTLKWSASGRQVLQLLVVWFSVAVVMFVVKPAYGGQRAHGTYGPVRD